MAKKKENDGVYKMGKRGFSPRTNQIIGIAFVIFVMVCCIVRIFVGGKTEDKSAGETTVTEANVDSESVDDAKTTESSYTDTELTETSITTEYADTEDTDGSEEASETSEDTDDAAVSESDTSGNP